eukprot:scaffold1750_cov19-Tisochrysis_lutea.AAC.3
MQVSEEEWRAKYESMKAALPTYKKMKKELGDVEVRRVCSDNLGSAGMLPFKETMSLEIAVTVPRICPGFAEVFVLAYTEEVLASEEERLLRALKSVEKKQGVAGLMRQISMR